MDSSLVLVPQPLSSIYTVHPSLLEILSFPGFFVATFSGIFPLPCSFSNPSCWFLISYLNPVCWNTSEVSLEQSFLYLYTLRVCVSQSCPTLCDPMDCSPPHSSIHRILQARILEWVAIPFCKGSSQPRDWTWVSCIAGRFFTVWATREAPLVFFPGEFHGQKNLVSYIVHGSQRVGNNWATNLSPRYLKISIR